MSTSKLAETFYGRFKLFTKSDFSDKLIVFVKCGKSRDRFEFFEGFPLKLSSQLISFLLIVFLKKTVLYDKLFDMISPI